VIGMDHCDQLRKVSGPFLEMIVLCFCCGPAGAAPASALSPLSSLSWLFYLSLVPLLQKTISRLNTILSLKSFF